MENFDRAKLITELQKQDTIVDTFLLLGPVESEIIELAASLETNTPDEIKKMWTVKPDVLSKYPDFDRGDIEIDETINMELCMQSFPDGYHCEVQESKPETKTMRAT